MFHNLVRPLAQYGAMRGPGTGMGDWFSFFPYGWGGVLLLIVIVVLVLTVFRRGGVTPGRAPDSPMDILKKRYARGEISREEFQSMKKDIEG